MLPTYLPNLNQPEDQLQVLIDTVYWSCSKLWDLSEWNIQTKYPEVTSLLNQIRHSVAGTKIWIHGDVGSNKKDHFEHADMR